MPKKTRAELVEEIQETQQFNLRMQVAIADLRMRNGELTNLVADKLPDDFKQLTPTVVPDSRYNRIYRLVNTAIKWANTSSPALLADLRTEADKVQNFLAEHYESRRTLSEEHIQKMQAGRKKGSAA